MKINKQILFIVSFIFICHIIDKIVNKDTIEGFTIDYYYDEFKQYLGGVYNYFTPCDDHSYRNLDTLKCEYVSCLDISIENTECEYHYTEGVPKRRPCHVITPSHASDDQFCSNFDDEETCPISRCKWMDDIERCAQKNFCNLQEDVCDNINNGVYLVEELLIKYLDDEDPIKVFKSEEHPNDIDEVFRIMKSNSSGLLDGYQTFEDYYNEIIIFDSNTDVNQESIIEFNNRKFEKFLIDYFLYYYKHERETNLESDCNSFTSENNENLCNFNNETKECTTNDSVIDIFKRECNDFHTDKINCNYKDFCSYEEGCRACHAGTYIETDYPEICSDIPPNKVLEQLLNVVSETDPTVFQPLDGDTEPRECYMFDYPEDALCSDPEKCIYNGTIYGEQYSLKCIPKIENIGDQTITERCNDLSNEDCFNDRQCELLPNDSINYRNRSNIDENFKVTNIQETFPSEPLRTSCETCDYNGHLYIKSDSATANSANASFCGIIGNWTKVNTDRTEIPKEEWVNELDTENGIHVIPCNVNKHFHNDNCSLCQEGHFAAQYHPLKEEDPNFCADYHGDQEGCNSFEMCQFYRHPSYDPGPGHCDFKFYSFHDDQTVLPDWLRVDNNGTPIMNTCIPCYTIGKTHTTSDEPDTYHQGVCKDCDAGVLESVERIPGDPVYECVSDTFCNDEEFDEEGVGNNLITDTEQFNDRRNRCICNSETYGNVESYTGLEQSPETEPWTMRPNCSHLNPCAENNSGCVRDLSTNGIRNSMGNSFCPDSSDESGASYENCNIKKSGEHYLNLDTQSTDFLDIQAIKRKIIDEATAPATPDIFPPEFLEKYTQLFAENSLTPEIIMESIAIDKEAVCYYNGSFGSCQRCTNTELKDNSEESAFIPPHDNIGECVPNCDDNQRLQQKCGNICETKNNTNSGVCYPHSKYTYSNQSVNEINESIFNLNPDLNLNYNYTYDNSDENDIYYPISHVKYDKFFSNLTTDQRIDTRIKRHTSGEFEVQSDDRLTSSSDVGLIKDYKLAEHITQSILCDPETTSDITLFNDCQQRWGCNLENSENDSEWQGNYIELPHNNRGSSNTLFETLPNLSKIDALHNRNDCSEIIDETLCNDSNRCIYTDDACINNTILDRYSNNNKSDFTEGGILNNNIYGENENNVINQNPGLIGRHELTFSIIDTPYKIEPDVRDFVGTNYGTNDRRTNVIEGFTDNEPNYIKHNANARVRSDAESPATDNNSYMKRSKDAQVDLLLSDEDADFSLFYDPTRYRKVDLYDACNQLNETSRDICEMNYVNMTNTEELLKTEIVGNPPTNTSNSSQCKYNSMTNECYSIDNPLKAYSKNNRKMNDEISPDTVFKYKDYDHLRYSNNYSEKKNRHNKPVSLHNNEELNKYKSYQGLEPDITQGAGETDDDYQARTLELINTNWNLYGGCDIETTPDRVNYPQFLFDPEITDTKAEILESELHKYQLKPIKDRHKQLIQQYVESKNETFNDNEYDKLFDYISDAYNYERPLVLDIYAGDDVADNHKLIENEHTITYESDAEDSQYIKHCRTNGKWNLPFYLNEETDLANEIVSDEVINEQISSKNMKDYINFPQCVQTIYNYHYLKTLNEGNECMADLQESANRITTSEMDLFDTYGINTGNYNNSDFHKFKDTETKEDLYSDDDKGLYNWFFGSGPVHQPDAPPRPAYLRHVRIKPLEELIGERERLIDEYFSGLYFFLADTEDTTEYCQENISSYEQGTNSINPGIECYNLVSLTEKIDNYDGYVQERTAENDSRDERWENMYGSRAWERDIPLLDDGLSDLQNKASSPLDTESGFTSRDPITSHSTNSRRDPNNFIGYDYFNYCNEDISKYPTNLQLGNNSGCDYQIGSMYSEYPSYPINSEAYYSNYLFTGTTLEDTDSPSEYTLYYNDQVTSVFSRDDKSFNSTLFDIDRGGRRNVYSADEIRDMNNPFADDYRNINFPGDNNTGGTTDNWKIHPEFNLYNCKGIADDDQKCHPANNKLDFTDKPLYRLWGDSIINWFFNTGEEVNPVVSQTRGELNINEVEHHSFIYTDPFHRMNVRRNIEPKTDRSDNKRIKYTFEPIVNNNMLWSTSGNTDKLKYVTPNATNIDLGVAGTLPSLPSRSPDTDPDLSAENPIDSEQSYFIEKYCALLSFPETHPSNNINYDNDWYNDISTSEIDVKQNLINDTNDCYDDDCVNYLDGLTNDNTNDWLKGLMGTGFKYTNYIMDCLPALVNDDDKWPSSSVDEEILGKCDNIKQIVENDISNKLALNHKDNLNISYNPLIHEKYPKLDESNRDNTDIYNNLTRVRVGGYCSGDNCDNTVKKPIEVDQRCVGIERQGYCFDGDILTNILDDTSCSSPNEWKNIGDPLTDDQINAIQQNNLKCANTNLNKGNNLGTIDNLYELNKETCEGNSQPRSDEAQCKYIPPRNIINLQKSKYQFMLFNENDSDMSSEPTADESITENNIMWENIILDKMKHICNGGKSDGECTDNGDQTEELRDFLIDNSIILENDRDKYSCKWIGNQDYCNKESPHVFTQTNTDSVSVCNYDPDTDTCGLNNRIIDSVNIPTEIESCNNENIILTQSSFNQGNNNGYIPDIFMIDDECVNCEGSQTRDPTDPYTCSQSCASYFSGIGDIYSEAATLEGQLLSNTMRCANIGSDIMRNHNYRFVDGRISSDTPTQRDILANCCEPAVSDTTTGSAVPDTSTLTCGEQFPSYDQNICNSMSLVYSGEPIWSPNNEYILAPPGSRDDTEYFYNTCCQPLDDPQALRTPPSPPDVPRSGSCLAASYNERSGLYWTERQGENFCEGQGAGTWSPDTRYTGGMTMEDISLFTSECCL